jgi:hypothetical protein
MSKADLLRDLDEEYRQFDDLLNGIGTGRMEQPGVAGFWSVKDIVAHITSWRRRTVQRFQALATGEKLPPPPWPAELSPDDAINAWLYERERNKSIQQVLEDSRQVYQQLRAAIAALPEETLADPSRFPWLEGNPLTARILFSHFHDEHEADMRAFLEQQGASGGKVA